MLDLEAAGKNVRINVLKRANAAGANGAHIAPSLSIVEIVTVLFMSVMKYDKENPRAEMRDRFFLSKGHGALAYYAAMYEAGIISEEDFLTFEKNGGAFPGQPSKNLDFGIEYSGGSLGLGLSYAIGLSLSNANKKNPFREFVLMGDGEINEGSVWESAMFAGYHHLENITAIIDRNSMQSDGFTEKILEFDIAGMFTACGWEVEECDGHDTAQLKELLSKAGDKKPRCIIANTVKGKGVSFMENSREWHHSRLTDEQLTEALAEIG